MSAPLPSAAALRLRRWRARQKRGAICVNVEVTEDLVETLIGAGFLSHQRADDRRAIVEALGLFHGSARVVRV